MFATALALIAQVTPTAVLRGKALAAYGATIGAAFAIGPFVGGSLTSAFGWRAIFLINVPLGVAALAIAATRVPESRDPERRGVDLPGQLSLIAGLFWLVFGLLRGNSDGWGSPGIIAALVAGVTLLAAFAMFEIRGRNPMLPLTLLRDRTFAGAQIAVFAISSGFFAVFLYLTLYLQSVLGLSPIETGLVYLPGTVLMFVVSGATANFSARVRPGVLVSGGLALVGSGLLALLLTTAHSSWAVMMPGVLLACLGTGLFNPAASAVALSALPPERERTRGGRQRHLPPIGHRARHCRARRVRAGGRRAWRLPASLRNGAPSRADRRGRDLDHRRNGHRRSPARPSCRRPGHRRVGRGSAGDRSVGRRPIGCRRGLRPEADHPIARGQAAPGPIRVRSVG